MSKEKKRVKKTMRCLACGEMFTPQGIAGHWRWAHMGERSPRQLPLEPKRSPSLVKPALPTEALLVLVEKAELQDHTEASPCCAARLRSAKQVLGIADGALDKCFICARCGEWYLSAPDGYLQVYADGSRGVRYLEHLPQEPVKES